MKRIILFLMLVLLLETVGCGKKVAPEQEANVSSYVQYEYVEEFDTLDDILKYSTDVVKATLVSTEDFDGRVNVYLFDVEENYFGHASDEIHMYDEYHEQYIIGHSYYLFLCGTENALYPHTIYTSVVKDFILDAMSPETAAFANGNEIQVNTAEIASVVSAAVTDGVAGAKAGAAFHVSNSSDVAAVSDEADVIVEIRVSSELAANKYASTYTVELLNTLKGPEGAAASHMILPPNLDTSTSYYIFLKESQECSGNYLLYSSVYPAIDTALLPESELSLD